MKKIARRTVVLFAVILLCAGATAHSAGVDMKEGEWETSTETTMTMGAMSMPPMAGKSTYCLTREDPVPKSEKDKDCKMVNQKVVGNTVSWRMECKKGEGEGEITYRGSTYDGNYPDEDGGRRADDDDEHEACGKISRSLPQGPVVGPDRKRGRAATARPRRFDPIIPAAK